MPTLENETRRGQRIEQAAGWRAPLPESACCSVPIPALRYATPSSTGGVVRYP
jgi:hypothetical protein